MRGVDVVGVYNFACSLREVLAKHPFLPHGCGLFSGSYFPSFSEGLSLRQQSLSLLQPMMQNFPSFSEGLSLRRLLWRRWKRRCRHFPSFSEGLSLRPPRPPPEDPAPAQFPFLFGGTFIEAIQDLIIHQIQYMDFPSFSEGLSLRRSRSLVVSEALSWISLPFRRDFH